MLNGPLNQLVIHTAATTIASCREVADRIMRELVIDHRVIDVVAFQLDDKRWAVTAKRKELL